MAVIDHPGPPPELRQPADVRSLLETRTPTGRRIRNGIANVWMWASLILVMIPLTFVIVYVVQKGIGVMSFEFLTADLPIRSQRPGGGIGPAIVGTLIITFGAALLAVPLGILGAVYLNEYGANSIFARVVRFMTEVMTGVPSIVMGLFVYTIFTLYFGLAAIGGSLALACLMLPVVIRSSEEMLKLVPSELREASYALGNTKWRTTLRVVLPAAVGGIVSGAMLAVARAAGETAPLLFTIGVVTSTNPNLFSGTNTALPTQIFANAISPYAAAQDRAWGAALTLIAIVFIFTVGARLIASRFRIKEW